ncbi:unnamed protein product [Mycena citricolor]|uniref:Homeobox domain-containing protein n=1 Tax=Mycena citricolor TaxID=2018698 RepID=A0AAD2JV12_9AGAR|nr:unnamed protein product [Mycena citricolor]
MVKATRSSPAELRADEKANHDEGESSQTKQEDTSEAQSAAPRKSAAASEPCEQSGSPTTSPTDDVLKIKPVKSNGSTSCEQDQSVPGPPAVPSRRTSSSSHSPVSASPVSHSPLPHAPGPPHGVAPPYPYAPMGHEHYMHYPPQPWAYRGHDAPQGPIYHGEHPHPPPPPHLWHPGTQPHPAAQSHPGAHPHPHYHPGPYPAHPPHPDMEAHSSVRLPSIQALLTEPYRDGPQGQVPRMPGYGERQDWPPSQGAPPPPAAPTPQIAASVPDRYPPVVASLPNEDSRPRTPQGMSSRKRGRLPKETTDFLKAWLHSHSAHPYPSEIEKKQMCHATGLSMSQVSNWMINGRRRILGPSYTASSRSSSHSTPPTGSLSSQSVVLSPPAVMLSAAPSAQMLSNPAPPAMMLRTPSAGGPQHP